MSEAYDRDSFFTAYIKWHYTEALSEFWGVVSNFLWFVLHFFSFKLLIKTLFSPWKRMKESYTGEGLNLERFFSALVVNTIMRVVGFITRFIILTIGVICILLISATSTIVFFIWIFAPFVLLGSLLLSITFFI